MFMHFATMHFCHAFLNKIDLYPCNECVLFLRKGMHITRVCLIYMNIQVFNHKFEDYIYKVLYAFRKSPLDKDRNPEIPNRQSSFKCIVIFEIETWLN